MKEVKGQFICINGERFYEIANYDAMQPFFISLASDTDLWMYLSSTGGLTAGRRSPNEALFPYYTDVMSLQVLVQLSTIGSRSLTGSSRFMTSPVRSPNRQ